VRSKRILATGAVIAALTLAVSACGSGGSDDGGESGDSAAPVVARGCQPENPLVPGNTGESCGHDIIELFTSTLYRYDAETSEPVADLAESVQTNDNQNFTVRIKKGVKFHDGTEVKAKNFVDAWNYTANGKNAQYTSYFYEPIEGFADTQCPSTDDEGACVGKPKTDKLSGLTVVDDHTFTIKTTEPVSNLPVRLGYTAFAPLPDSFFDDPKAFEKQPIGAGPYEVTKYEPGKSAELKHFADYGGDGPKGNVDKITFRIYDDEEAAYNDLLAGNLDVLDTLPTSALVGEKYKTDLGERSDQEAYPAIQTVQFPPDKVNPAYKNTDLRHAISLAIDRQKIIDDQFEGAREKADSWGAPGIEGFNAGTCGDLCTFDPDRAKDLFKKAGGFDGGKLSIAYNADSDHKGWVTATCNSIRDVLGVDCVATPVPDFATFRQKIGERKMESMVRSGWIQDYPHIENFLTPQYGTGASSNDSDYSNPAFDAKLVEAAKATGEESLALYKEAEEMLPAGMPSIPMWYYTATIGWSDKVTDVRVSQASGRPDLFSMNQK
jgi:oligopeptide transport system substrate-binding protein